MKAVWYVIVKENDKNYLVLQENPVTTFWFHHIDKIEGLKPDIKSTSDLWNAVSFFLGGGGGLLLFTTINRRECEVQLYRCRKRDFDQALRTKSLS